MQTDKDTHETFIKTDPQNKTRLGMVKKTILEDLNMFKVQTFSLVDHMRNLRTTFCKHFIRGIIL